MSSPSAKRPNILLITTDQQRHDALSINNPAGPLRTSNLDSIAAKGVNFSRAYTTCPVCIPARRSILTGLHPTTHGLKWYEEGVDWDPPFTLPGLLGQAGYQTQLIGKMHLHPQKKRYGFDHQIRSESPNHRPTSATQNHNDYTHWLSQQNIPGQPNNHGISSNSRLARPFHLEENYHQTSWLVDQAMDFFEHRRDPSCPWFMHLSFWAPHPPLIPPQAYWDMYKDIDESPAIGTWTPLFDELPRGLVPESATGPFDEQEMRRAMAGYYGLIHHIDDRIRALLERMFTVADPAAREPCYILFTSDHGEMLGDHHLFRKSLPYEGSSHVPFFIGGRNVDITPASRTCDELVCLEDIAATMLDLAGAEIPSQLNNDLDSRSLAGALRGETIKPRDTLFGQIGRGERRTNYYVVHGDHKYIRYPATGDEQLFNVIEDPNEMTDLSADEALLKQFRSRLNAYLERTGQPVQPEGELKPCENKPPRAIWGETDE